MYAYVYTHTHVRTQIHVYDKYDNRTSCARTERQWSGGRKRPTIEAKETYYRGKRDLLYDNRTSCARTERPWSGGRKSTSGSE